jgi:capsular exopolysaccharide synthesis family protein
MQAVRTVKRLDPEKVERVTGHACPGAPVVWNQDPSPAAEKFRLLAHRIHRARGAKPLQTVLIASAIPGEGRSTVAVNLAATLVRQGKRTVLIDADLRLSELHKMLGLDADPGLSEVLTGRIELDRALRRVDPPDLYFLGSGARSTDPGRLLDAPKFASILQEAREAFDWVILDSPPLNPLADAQCVASVCDAVLLVVRWGITPRHELEHAIEVLDGHPLLGMVINMFDDPQDSKHYSYYENSKRVPARPFGAASVDVVEPSRAGYPGDQNYADILGDTRG